MLAWSPNEVVNAPGLSPRYASIVFAEPRRFGESA